MSHHTVKPWTLPPSYAGAHWDGFHSSGFGQSRDSDALERSNFRCAWTAISKASPEAQVVREGHWAVGWVEWIAIPSSDAAGIACAEKLCEECRDYPVLDEDDFSNEEEKEAQEVWAHCYDPKERIEYIRAHRGQFEFRDLADLMGCVRGTYFAGYASELLT